METSKRRMTVFVAVCLFILVGGGTVALYWLPNVVFAGLNCTTVVQNEAGTWRMQANLQRWAFGKTIHITPLEVMPPRTFATEETVRATTAFGVTLTGKVAGVHEMSAGDKKTWLEIQLTPSSEWQNYSPNHLPPTKAAPNLNKK